MQRRPVDPAWRCPSCTWAHGRAAQNGYEAQQAPRHEVCAVLRAFIAARFGAGAVEREGWSEC